MGTFSAMKYLGGTIAIPDTFPDLAAATYYDAIELRDNEALNRVVQIVESKPHSRVTRFVSLRDVVAVFATQETDPRKIRAAWLDPDNWSTDAKAIKRNVKGINGIVYVAEPAPCSSSWNSARPQRIVTRLVLGR